MGGGGGGGGGIASRLGGMGGQAGGMSPWESGVMPGRGILPTPNNNLSLTSPQAQLAIASNLLSNLLRTQQDTQPQVIQFSPRVVIPSTRLFFNITHSSDSLGLLFGKSTERM